MTPQEMLLKQKLSLLQLARELNNIKKACSIQNVSRQHYYDIKDSFERFGIEGLKPKERGKPVMPNQTEKSIEEKIIDYSLEHPSFGKNTIAMNLRLEEGIYITASGVRSIWERNKMGTRKNRYTMLEKRMSEKGFALSSNQIQELVIKEDLLKEQHVLSYFPGYLLCQDTFEVGYIKGVGKIYMQAVIDTYGSFGFAKLYKYKTALTAVDILTDKVLPFYSTLSLPVLNILTDNGSEYCGNYPSHDYELVLEIFNINHRRTKIRCPQTNGFVERFNRTVLEEFFAVAFRTNWYYSIEQLQIDLDNWMFKYNFKRPHQGYRAKGKTPSTVLLNPANRQKLLTA
jgi:transposase InsO family protein